MRFSAHGSVAMAMVASLATATPHDGLLGLGSSGKGLDLAQPIHAGVDLNADLSGQVLVAGLLADIVVDHLAEVDVGAKVAVICEDCHIKGEIDASISLEKVVPALSLSIKDVEILLDLDVYIGAAATIAVNLVTPAKISLPLPGLNIEALVHLDLILGVHTELDLSAGVYVSLPEASLATDILSGDILDVDFSGVAVKVLPIKVRIGCTELLADLRLRVDLGVSAAIDLDEILPLGELLPGLDIPAIGAGLEVAVFANLLEYVGLFCTAPECPLVKEVYGLNVGAAVELDVAVEDLLSIHLAPTIVTAVLSIPTNTICIPSYTASPSSYSGLPTPSGSDYYTGIPTSSFPSFPTGIPTSSFPSFPTGVPTSSGPAGEPTSSGPGFPTGVPTSTGPNGEPTPSGPSSSSGASTPSGPGSSNGVSTPSGPASEPTPSGSVSTGIPTASGSDSSSSIPTSNFPGSSTGVPTSSGPGSEPSSSGSASSSGVPSSSGSGYSSGVPSSSGPAPSSTGAATTPAPGGNDGYVTSTIVSTQTFTVTACAVNVPNCPAGYQTSATLTYTTSFTTVCPGTAIGSVTAAPVPTSTGGHSIETITKHVTTMVPCDSTSTFVPPAEISTVPYPSDIPTHPASSPVASPSTVAGYSSGIVPVGYPTPSFSAGGPSASYSAGAVPSSSPAGAASPSYPVGAPVSSPVSPSGAGYPSSISYPVAVAYPSAGNSTAPATLATYQPSSTAPAGYPTASAVTPPVATAGVGKVGSSVAAVIALMGVVIVL